MWARSRIRSNAVKITDRECHVLRELARRVAEIAALPIQAERVRLWKDHNSLKPRRPMVLAFPEGAWRELVPEGELECEHEELRVWETALRQTIFHHERIRDDHPVTRTFNVGWVVRRSGYGLEAEIHRTDPVGAYRWEAPVKTAADLKRLHASTVEIDRDESARKFELAEEVLGDILQVRPFGGFFWSLGLTGTLIRLRGLDRMMMDMYDEPQLLHELMALLRDSTLSELDTYEREGVLTLNNGPTDYVGSGGLGCTDELPAEDFDGRVRCKDLWVLGESQEFVGVGPQQFYEFALQYQLPLLDRFGLVCYGCCEPLDRKFDLIIKHIPKLRRVSVAPWCDRALAAEKLADRYIYSWKPNPSMICRPTVDYDAVEKVTRETIETARGCCLEMVMKDTHTVHGDAERFTRWSEIASRLAAEAA